MQITHQIQYVNGYQIVHIYVNYPDEYEFSLDITKFKENIHNVSFQIKKYIHDNFEDIKEITFVLVLNGIVVGSVLLPALDQISKNDFNDSKTTIQEIADTDTSKNTNTNTENQTDSEDELKKSDLAKNSETTNQNTDAEKKEDTKVENKVNTEAAKNVVVPKVQAETQPKVDTPAPSQNHTQEQTVSVKLNSGQVIKLSVTDYVIGVVGAEMPASFESEALKAQALAARTYAYKNIAKTLSATVSDQVYKTNTELKNMWGGSYSTYYNRIKNAVLATKNQYITYNGEYINALYFSTSNGKTEDPVYVWGNSVPYLKSVDSHFDTSVKSYSGTKSTSLSTLNSVLGTNVKSNADIKIISKTTGDRVNKISFSGKTFTGVRIRSLFGLRSADFDINISGNNVTFTTRGYGHGVGMSQYGANQMAKAGYNYQQIIKHYYTGVAIQTK